MSDIYFKIHITFNDISELLMSAIKIVLNGFENSESIQQKMMEFPQSINIYQ